MSATFTLWVSRKTLARDLVRQEKAAFEGVIEGQTIRITSEGVTVVDSTGLFIAVGVEKFEALLDARRNESR